MLLSKFSITSYSWLYFLDLIKVKAEFISVYSWLYFLDLIKVKAEFISVYSWLYLLDLIKVKAEFITVYSWLYFLDLIKIKTEFITVYSWLHFLDLIKVKAEVINIIKTITVAVQTPVVVNIQNRIISTQHFLCKGIVPQTLIVLSLYLGSLMASDITNFEFCKIKLSKFKILKVSIRIFNFVAKTQFLKFLIQRV